MTRRRSRGCLSISFSTPMRRRRRRSPSISTPPTTRCTGIRKGVSSTAITTTTAICRSTCSAAGICWPPNCARPISTPAPAASRRWRGSSPASASAGPAVRILLRADSGFAREALMAWCENNGVDFLFGLAKNAPPGRRDRDRTRRGRRAEPDRPASRRAASRTSPGGRARAGAASAGSSPRRNGPTAQANPRFVVTSLTREEHEARHLYEKLYCARGEMENRIKECQLDLYADRTSAHTMRANQLRLWFASMAYVLLCALRRIGLAHTQFARASCGTIRLKLLEDRRAGAHQRAPHQARHALGLPLSSRVSRCPCRTRRGRLTNQKTQRK